LNQGASQATGREVFVFTWLSLFLLFIIFMYSRSYWCCSSLILNICSTLSYLLLFWHLRPFVYSYCCQAAPCWLTHTLRSSYIKYVTYHTQ